MFRDDIDVALNDALVQCQSNAAHFRYTAELIQNTEEAALLRRLADQRDALAQRLAEQMQSRGELPGMPDTERTTLEELRDRFTAALTASGRQTVLRERVEDEMHLADLARTALQQVPSGPARDVLEEVHRQAQAGADSLRASL
jgi:hypothetical protein